MAEQPAQSVQAAIHANKLRSVPDFERFCHLIGLALGRRLYQADPCVYCGTFPARDHRHPRRFTLDHLIPRAVWWANRSAGNADYTRRLGHSLGSWQNLAAACARCNAERGTAPFLVWMAERRCRRG